MGRTRHRVVVRFFSACFAALAAGPASAGSFDLFGIGTEYKLTLGYAIATRVEDADPALINGPIDVMQVSLNTNPIDCPTLPQPCVGSFGHTGMPTTVLFDDGNRDFEQGSLLNNRVSGYGEVLFKMDNFGLGDVGAVFSGAAHYDRVFLAQNDNDSPETVNRHQPIVAGEPTGNHRAWT